MNTHARSDPGGRRPQSTSATPEPTNGDVVPPRQRQSIPPLVLAVEDVTVDRGGRVIVTEVTFRLKAGEALIVTGDNGSGKTSLLRAIGGLLPVAGGRITLVGGSVAEDDETPSARCHLAGHLDGLKNALGVRDNLAFWAEYLDQSGADATTRDARIAKALAAFDLTALADIPAGYLSAGQKRRLGLARLLVAHRPLWLLDEPSVSLDAASVTLLRGIIAGHLTGGGIVVATSHVDLGITGARHLVLTAPAFITDESDAVSGTDPGTPA